MPPKSPFAVVARTLVGPRSDPEYGTPGRSDWLDVDWPAHTHTTRIGGREVVYVDIGSGEPLVFIHGLGACWQTWLENLPFFARTHRCIALDLPGFGASEMPEGEITIERYAQVVDELLGGLGVGRAAVVGNSMGGFIAVELARSFPTLVERLVLVSAAVFWQEYRRARPLVALASATEGTVGRALIDSGELLSKRPRLRAAALAFGGFHLPHLLAPELQRELLLTAKRTPGFLPALRALASFPLREELPRLRSPTLVVWGTDDTLVGVEHASELERLIPDARKVIFERTGHVPMLERPLSFNAVTAEFLAERGRAADEDAAEAAPSA